jgi:CheY-like chemotaxis protein
MAGHFLIIDDSPTERHHLSSLLRELGHNVDLCESTDGALERIQGQRYTAVFLDVVLPDQDGYKFLRMIRQDPAVKQQYVILCSTKKTKLEIDYGIKRAGADDYLPKPVERQSLIDVLEKVM